MVSNVTMKIFAVLILSCIFALASCYIEYDSWISIELSHAVDADNPEIFTYRGNVTIPSLNSGLSSTIQDALSDDQRRSLKIFAQTNEFYRMRATVLYANGVQQTFLTSSKACKLLLAQLNDVLWISIDGAGFVNAITQTSYTSGLDDCSSPQLSTSGLEDFNTDVLIRHTELAPVPDTTSFIQKIERDREAREKGEVRDNRGFFAKYWMYILPVVLFVFISGATNQEAAK